MITRPDINNHDEARGQIQPWISCAFVASSENGAQLRPAKTSQAVDCNQKKNQSSLTKQTCAGQKKRAGRRVHKIVLPSAKEINLITRPHVFAGGVPEFVIKDGLAA